MVRPRILWYADSPTCPSGFGNVSRGILQKLCLDYEITVFGINETGLPQDEFPFEIIPAQGRLSIQDPLGRLLFLAHIRERPKRYDAIFMLQDSFILSRPIAENVPFVVAVKQECEKANIPLIVYFPIDARPRPGWIRPLKCADRYITYTQWGAEQCAQVTNGAVLPEIIYHGVDPEIFHAFHPDVRSVMRREVLESIKKSPDTFVLFYVGANQRRKAIDWLAKTFYTFKRQAECSDTILVMHTQENNPRLGWNIRILMDNFYLQEGQDWMFLNTEHHVSQAEMNRWYNIADALVLHSAEGWGMPATEALSAGCPAILANHAALGEIGQMAGLGRDRMIDCPDDPNFYQIMPSDNDVVRRIPDVHDGVRIMNIISNDPFYARHASQDSFRFVRTKLNWGLISEKWSEVFDEEIRKRRRAKGFVLA